MIVSLLALEAASEQHAPAREPVRIEPARESYLFSVDEALGRQAAAARDLLDQGDPVAAVPLLYEIARQGGRGLVALGRIPNTPLSLFQNARLFAEEMLLAQPAANLSGFRTTHDADAGRWLADYSLRAPIVSAAGIATPPGFIATTSAGSFLWRRAERAASLGQFAAAVQALASLETWRKSMPALAADRVAAQFPFPPAEPSEIGTSLETRIAKALAICRAGMRGTTNATGLPPWQFPLSAEERTSLLNEPAVVLWSHSLPPDGLNTGRTAIRGGIVDVSATSVPLVVGQHIYLPTAEGVFGFQAKSGLPLFGAATTFLSPSVQDAIITPTRAPVAESHRVYPAPSAAGPLGQIRETPPALPAIGRPDYRLVHAEGRVYARLGWPITPAAIEPRTPTADIVCLDMAETEGGLVWKSTAHEEFRDEPPWVWEGVPVVLRNRVYVPLSRLRTQLEWGVACLDADSGQLVWMAPVGVSRQDWSAGRNRVARLTLVTDGVRLYFATGAGSVLAVDPANGDVVWGVTYPSVATTHHSATDPRTGHRRGQSPLSSGVFLATSEHRVYVAPPDAPTLLCLDSSTGRPVFASPLTRPAAQIVGIHDDTIVIGDTGLAAYHYETGRLLWRFAPEDPVNFSSGQGTLAGGLAVWPTRENILLFNVVTGLPVRQIPLRQPPAIATGGHVVVAPSGTDGHGVVLLLSEKDRLICYGFGTGGNPGRPPSRTLVSSSPETGLPLVPSR